MTLLRTLQHKLDECRQIVKIIRANIRSNRSTLNLPLPSIDNVTRWNSTYDMLKSLLSLKQQINSNEVDFCINCEIDWSFIENFINAFKPMAICTKQLQTEQYIIGDFYRDWLLCESKLKGMPENILAKKLQESMQKTKQKLLDNIAFISSLYFDPRFNYLDTQFLNDEQKKNAVVHILKTNTTLQSLNGGENSSTQNNIGGQDNVPVAPDDPYVILEEELTLTCSSTLTQINGSVRQQLYNLAYGQRLSFGTDVLAYWKNKSFTDKDLSKLAEVVLAVPSSQVSVERAFSALSTTITKQRSRLSKETINNLLIVKLNSNLLENMSY